jgi:FtsH-binding integral membrane protein
MYDDPRNPRAATFTQPRAVIDLSLPARATFLARVYSHLFGALVAFSLIEIAIFTSGLADSIVPAMVGGGGMRWLLIIGAFIIVGNIATRTAHTAESRTTQYLALGAFVVMEALIFVPLLWFANTYAGGGVIASAGFVSLAGFGGLTAIALFSRKDFSFLGTLLKWGMLCAILLIVASVIFGFQLGVVFSVAMVALAGGAILFTTQKIMNEYPEDRYVGASLQLFSAVAMLFYYVLMIFMQSRD